MDSSKTYTDSLSAQDFILWIANDYDELSQDKIRWQRDDWKKAAQSWIEANWKDKQ
jgi:hypothetical protein